MTIPESFKSESDWQICRRSRILRARYFYFVACVIPEIATSCNRQRDGVFSPTSFSAKATFSVFQVLLNAAEEESALKRHKCPPSRILRVLFTFASPS